MAKSEHDLESHLVDMCDSYGVDCRKLIESGRRGWPDRTLFKHGAVMFVEVKRPDGKGELSAPQRLTKLVLEQSGFEVVVLDRFEDVEPLVKRFVYGISSSVSNKKH